MAADDDDWVGEPPEGRHAPGTGRPQHWRNQKPYLYATALLGFMFVIVLVLILAG